MTTFDVGGWAGWALAVISATVLGWLLETIVGGWLAACERDWGAEGDSSPGGKAAAPARSRSIAVAFAIAAVALWWWEVHARGLLPRGVDGPVGVSTAADAWRWTAHVLLFWLLAAATWIDFRFRVIPDWVTTRGFLAGLAAVWALPGILLPVTVLRARPFAAAIEVADVLGWAGPLEAMPGLAVPASPWALVSALGMFVAWWWVATGPADRFADGVAPSTEPSSDTGEEPRGEEPAPAAAPVRIEAARLAVLLAGMAAVTLAWWWGGTRFAALQSSLVGAVVAGGLVWTTRAGGSLALGREAMGLGDVTLMAMVGAWLGWQASVLACFLGVLIGLVHGVWQMAGGRGSEMPFGPSLCAGVVAVVAGWRQAWGLSAESFAEPWRMAGVMLAVVVGTAVALFVWSSLPAAARRLVLLATLALLALLVALVTVGGF